MTLKTLNHPHPPVGEVPLLASRGASRKSGKLKQQIWKICRFDILRVNILDSRNFGFVGQAVCNLQAADVVSFNCHLVSSDLQSTFSFSRIVMQQHFFDVFNLEQNRNGCRSSANICNIFRNSCLSIWQIFGALGDLMMSQRLLNLTSSQPKKAITLPWILANSLVSSRRGVNQQRLLGILWPRNPDGLKLGTVGNVVLPRRLGWGASMVEADAQRQFHPTFTAQSAHLALCELGVYPSKIWWKNMRFLN